MAVQVGHGLTGAVDSRQWTYVHWSESQLNCPLMHVLSFDACISQHNCYDVGGCKHCVGSGTLTGLRSWLVVGWLFWV